MPVAPINGTSLYYEVEGEGDWVIFVHGGGSTHLAWWRQVYFLRDKGFKCLTYDARGLGQSEGIEDAPAGPKDLLALMDHLKIDKAHLNGWSAGGWAVSGVAQQHPQRVLSLTMTDTPFGFYTKALNKWSGEMLDKFSKGFDIRVNSIGPWHAKTDPKAEFLDHQLGRLNAGVRPPSPADYAKRFGNVYEHMRDTKPVDYSKFPVPTLFTVGEMDGLTLPWLIRDTAKAVGGAKLVEFPRSGHGPQIEQSDTYNYVLLEFMRNADAKRRDPKFKPPKWSLIDFYQQVNGNAPRGAPGAAGAAVKRA